jgi:hypothetical protein
MRAYVWLQRVAVAGCIAVQLLAFIFAITHIGRPPDTTEAEILHEASRLARGLSIYQDPTRAADALGGGVIRKYALYTPAWPFILSLLPEVWRLFFARLVAIVCWFIAVPSIALLRRKSQAIRRLLPVYAATGIGIGHFLLARASYGGFVDPLCIALSAFAFRLALSHSETPSIREGEAPATAAQQKGLCATDSARARSLAIPGLLLGLSLLLKPIALGIPMGLALHLVTKRRFRALAELCSGIAVSAGALGAAYLLLGSATWPQHMFAASANPWSSARVVDFISRYSIFLGLPHLFVALYTRRSCPGGSTVLACCTLVSTVLMGKLGSASNYWLEPTAVSLIAIAQHQWVVIPGSSYSTPSKVNVTKWSALAIGALLVAISSVMFFVQERKDAKQAQVRLAWLTTTLANVPRSTVYVVDPNLSYVLKGEVGVTPWQISLLVRQGKFPMDRLRSDLSAACVFVYSGPSVKVEAGATSIESSIFNHELRTEIVARFRETETYGDDLHVMRAPDCN